MELGAIHDMRGTKLGKGTFLVKKRVSPSLPVIAAIMKRRFPGGGVGAK